MSHQHSFLKFARKVGTARTDEGQTFKKPFQTVRRPPTLQHNMHEDFVRHPPKNIPEDQFGRGAHLKWGPNKLGRKSNVWGQEGLLCRIKPSDVERRLMEDASVQS